MARELHDGLAQELSYIAAETNRIRPLGGQALIRVTDAAQRALDESRRAIAALSLPPDEPLASLLSRVAEDVGLRGGLRVDLDVDTDLQAPAEIGEALLRVVREAVSNAAKHSQATTVRVEAKNGDQLHLRISDDGEGFDPSQLQATPKGGLGLTSMRERVEALGGRFRLESAPGRGTEIDVVLP
jgi:signal transduction histidine kinase